MSGRALLCAAAYSVDLAVGDPPEFPHPVRWMGRGISSGERWLRPGTRRPEIELMKGAILSAAIIAGAYAGAKFSMLLSRRAHPVLGDAVEVLLAFTALATRSLLVEAGAVVDALDAHRLPEARQKLAMIVGRDTACLDESEMARAVIETAAESICDGIVAPLMYLAVGGVPLAFAYKAANTLDSMIGHPDEPYRYFGRVAARVDDVANLVPARLTAGLIVAAAALTGYDSRAAWHNWRRDGDKHPSPNAGQSEAAMAGALRVRLGGLNYYDGKPARKPYLGDGANGATVREARASLRIAGVVSLLACSVAVLLTALLSNGSKRR